MEAPGPGGLAGMEGCRSVAYAQTFREFQRGGLRRASAQRAARLVVSCGVSSVGDTFHRLPRLAATLIPRVCCLWCVLHTSHG
jgi:hypothetical protein